MPEAERGLILDITQAWKESLLQIASEVGEITITEKVRNPYFVGPPVEGSLFVGREDIMRHFLDYGSIVAKKEGYGPIGKGGNGLILHSALVIEPEKGQSIGLLWQKLWNREPKPKLQLDETLKQKKKRQAAARKEARNRPFEQKESYKWVEALTTIENLVSQQTRVIHVFDREGDITEVFDKTRQLQHTGVLVRAAHNRSLDSDSERLWSKLLAQPDFSRYLLD
uniref:Putative transposase n=1 Tax=Nostoc flagelliforme str. Sunitezuoqi TaxID=676037 RepID=E7DQB2_9NOSO|nr:putative transposase [Nostoc flagelliforme str. Sunitezuoqi]